MTARETSVTMALAALRNLRPMVLVAATVLLVAALGTAIALGSGPLRPPAAIDQTEIELGIFAPAAGRIVFCADGGLWTVDPSAPVARKPGSSRSESGSIRRNPK